MSKIWNFLKSVQWRDVFLFTAAMLILGATIVAPTPKKENLVLKDYKDGIQNHLVYDIKNQCYFVRANDEVTVYLVRVADCDRAK
jgi:hypothetical protein